MKMTIVGKWAKKALIILLALVYLVPLYIALVNSIKPYAEIIKNPIGLPAAPTLGNFVEAYQTSHILQLYLNSIFITVVSVALLILLSSMAAYVIARRKGRGYQILYVFGLAGIMVPPVITLVPSINTLKTLGLLYTPEGLFLFYVGTYFSTAIFLYVQFIKTIPASLDEAAIVDGSSTIGVFFRIIFPLVKPCTATTVIFLSMWIWNDFLNPMYILGTKGGRTITTGIYQSIGSLTSKWNVVFSNVVLASLPIVILYLCMQKQFMKGMTSGAIKG